MVTKEIAIDSIEEYMNQYKELKDKGNWDELEALIRNRMANCPNDIVSITKTQLVNTLIEKISQNPNLINRYIDEIRTLLIELYELNPKNKTVVSNYIKFETLLNNDTESEKYMREYLEINPLSYKIKIELANLLMRKYKTQIEKNGIGQASFLQEATDLANQVLERKPRNSYAMGILLKEAKWTNNHEREVYLLRKSKEDRIHNPLVDELLSGALLACCLDDVRKGIKIKKDDERVLEAKEICQEVAKKKPESLYNITFLITIARLQKDRNEEERLLKLKISLDPTDVKAQRSLSRNRSREFECEWDDKKIEAYSDEFKVEDFMEYRESVVEEELSSRKYCAELLNAINSGNRTVTLQILNEMKQDTTFDANTKKIINSMIELAKSNKMKSHIALRGMVKSIR